MDENQKTTETTEKAKLLGDPVAVEPKIYKKLQNILIIYSSLVVLLLPISVAKDLTAANPLLYPFASTWLKLLLITFVVYFVRCVLLIIPLRRKNPKWRIITFFGIGFAVLPEVIVFIASLAGMLSEPSCSSSGPFSNCGWSTIVFLPVILAAILQAIGMFIGLIVAWLKKDETGV